MVYIAIIALVIFLCAIGMIMGLKPGQGSGCIWLSILIMIVAFAILFVIIYGAPV